MLKLEHNECNILLAILEVSQFQGKDVLDIARIVEKLQKEAIKTTPDTVIQG